MLFNKKAAISSSFKLVKIIITLNDVSNMELE